jgi:acetyl esterase
MPLEPETARVLELINSSTAPSLSAGTPEQARAGFRFMTVDLRDPATLAPVRSSQDVVLPGPAGELPARVYRPDVDGRCRPSCSCHGGASSSATSTPTTTTAGCSAGGRGGGAVVDYRLAPSTASRGFEDCRGRHRWAAEHVDELGGDARAHRRGGDSDGRGLATASPCAGRARCHAPR